jgi:hypothetical protein
MSSNETRTRRLPWRQPAATAASAPAQERPPKPGFPSIIAQGATPHPAPPLVVTAGVALRDAEAFRMALLAIVEAEMAKLTDASAVDEWHRTVLDPRIAAEVEQEVRRIETAARERHTVITGDQAATRAHLAQIVQSQEEAEAALGRSLQAVRVARARVEERRTGTTPESVDVVVVVDSASELEGLRAEITSQREAIARALDVMRVESEQQLASEALAAEQAVRDLDRRIVEQERLHDAAAAEVERARERYRGVDPLSPVGSDAPLAAAAQPGPEDEVQDPAQGVRLGEVA